MAESDDVAVQLALWEEYADEVEEQMRVLLADNALLQAALADVRSSLAHERPGSTSGAGLASTLANPPLMSMCSAYAACCQWIRHDSCIVEVNVSQELSRDEKSASACSPSTLGCISAAGWCKGVGALCRAERV